MRTLAFFVSLLVFFNGSSQTSFTDDFNLAVDLLQKNDFKASISSFSKAIKKKEGASNNYKIAEAYIYRAYCYSNLKEFKSAYKDLEEAIKIKPEYVKIYVIKSSILYADKKFRECVETCDKGLSYTKYNEDLVITKAEALMQLKDYPAAIAGLRQALEYDPKQVSILNILAHAFLRQKTWDSAVVWYSRVIELNPQNPEAFFNRGTSYSYMQNYKQAAADIERGMEIDTAAKYVGYNNLGFFLKIEQKEYKDAIAYFDKAIALKPDFAFAYSNRAFAKINIGDVDGAFADIRQSLRLDPTNSFAYKNFGIIYLKTGDKKNACQQFQKALDLDYTKDYDEEVNTLQKENCK